MYPQTHRRTDGCTYTVRIQVDRSSLQQKAAAECRAVDYSTWYATAADYSKTLLHCYCNTTNKGKQRGIDSRSPPPAAEAAAPGLCFLLIRCNM